MANDVAVPMAMQRVEVITDGGRRRRYDEEKKLRLVRGAFSPGVKVAGFARIEGVASRAWTRAFCTAGAGSISAGPSPDRASRRWW